ncbi:MAG: hypothetical protein Q9214_000054 [Letrouitia sp. 1 TL-2023]
MLDITDDSSVEAFTKLLQDEHRAIDVLINNASVFLNSQTNAVNNAKITLETNYWGTLRNGFPRLMTIIGQMCRALIPLLKKGGRIVNVSSKASSLKSYSGEIQQRFRDPNMSLHSIEQLLRDFQILRNTLKSSANGTEYHDGWTPQAYSVSKAAINALTFLLAREHPELVINACCPGWVATDMGNILGSPPKSTGDGAKIPIRLGFEDIGGVSGRFWYEKHDPYP